MKIHYEIIDNFSTKNQEEIVKFVEVLINLLEIYKGTIPFSSFEEYGFNSLKKIESFVEIINNLKTGDMSRFIIHTGALFSVSQHKNIFGADNRTDLDFQTNLYLDYEENPIPTLKLMLRELVRKGYKKEEEKFAEKSKEPESNSWKREDKKYMDFDGKRTIYYKNERHSFQTKRGFEDKGLPLEFFKILWENRSEIKGKQITKGSRQEGLFYARTLDLVSGNDGSFVYEKGKSKKTIKNLTTGINRIFREKKFPAKIDTKGGILLEVKNH